ncbi:hypothetical protein DL766_005630 [Monosporascus sp. MC13-8B]|uniref:BZIP domain-containing protein n=1 Tax=Monosporascus cannonballus TaxID=155416 RepID=A0ABY0GV95_9PEZI|nr:hypothetical protein DL763_010129 [Monosporascus cannonballus]RYO74920.1 hypothetical protein DL762_010265 [Monosporascus cannonballus]RYP28928.1 hypothetical protein DL766_005630 [Monosporascus sp. MC13-8B]
MKPKGQDAKRSARPSGTENTVTLRRERGKRAQRAFRQRQIDAIRGLQEENQRLRDAIAKIGGAVSHSESPLIEVIGDACRIAGVEAPRSISSSESPQSVAGNRRFDLSAPLLDKRGEVEVSAGPPLGWTETNHQGLVRQNSPGIEYQDQLVSNGDLDSATGRRDNSENGGIEFGSEDGWSPNPIPPMTWAPERVLPLADPPPDIIPYLALRPPTNSGPPAEDAVATTLDVFYATVRREKLPLIQNLLHARLQFRRRGYLEAGTAHPARRDPVAHALYADQIVAELERVGARKRDFLTPFDVAARLRAQLGEAEYPVLEAALCGSPRSSEHVPLVRQLVRMITRNAMCFGDSPRWTPEAISRVAASWLAGTRKTAMVM